tara:strand:+ start:390 stop:689 length:300 start_codon:yes stop_codon:yes gene_type:complete
MSVANIYIKMNPNMDLDKLYLKLKKSYQENSKIRYILDASEGKASSEIMRKIKTVFDKFKKEEEKLLGTYIIVDGIFKKKIIQGFISLIGKKDKVKIIP